MVFLAATQPCVSKKWGTESLESAMGTGILKGPVNGVLING